MKLRNQQVEEGIAGKAQEIAFKGFESTMKRPVLYNISSRAGRLVQKPLQKEGSLRPLPGPLGAWTGSREMPTLAEKSFRQLWKEGI
ncbi:MAG: lactate utilization protein LutB domain-containing protein [Rubrobacter sp.]